MTMQWQLATNQILDAKDIQVTAHAIKKRNNCQLIPIRFVHDNTLSRVNRIIAGFDGLVLSKIINEPVEVAQIIHGDNWSTANVRVETLLPELTKTISKLKAFLAAASPPALVLNRHCPECEFRDRCRRAAVEKDELSLLARLTVKERARLNRRGIFTVNQLSYTFRPHRRPKHLAAKPEKYHHALKALAIRENKIHVIGNPQLRIDGTPVYLDVEALPDREFYYLIGLRIERTGRPAELHSLWADAPSDERYIWMEFLAIIATVEQPVLLHYGSAETKFMKQMCDRYGGPVEGTSSARAVETAINVLSVIFATVYFPSYSNGLKENARFLGFEWADTTASGLQSIVWRYRWEESNDATIRDYLISYNMDDCVALSVVARTLRELTGAVPGVDETHVLTGEVVHVDQLEENSMSKWRPFTSPIADFEKVNRAARWDYQRDRLFIRSGRARKNTIRQSARCSHVLRVQKVVRLGAPTACPQCGKRWRLKGRLVSRTVQDLVLGKDSIKRRVVQYEAQMYLCRSCRCEYGPVELQLHGRRWGWNILSYFLYHVVGLFIPQLTVQHSMNRLFGCRLVRSSLNQFKIKASTIYSGTKDQILSRLISGDVIHADETRASIKGHLAYVWVLTSLREVVYVLTETREGETVQQLLKGFKGVLISDFYAAYESIECPQQKCLLHLMRDLNDDVLGNSFDEEAKVVVGRFGTLLRSIVDTIDRRGLKAHFLRKHLVEVDGFYKFIDKTEFHSEVARKIKQRFSKNQNKLFTFLNYDGVPWNNNNAEHAIKAFARLREVISGLSTKKGIEEYLTLLSISETCRYRGIDFLNFVRSGEKDVAMFELDHRGVKS